MLKILYKFPSRERPEKFFAAVDNIAKFSASDNYQILASFDNDDVTMNNESVLNRLRSYKKVDYCIRKSNNKVHAINRDKYAGNFDILIVMSDDFEFIKEGFDDIIREHMMLHFPNLDGVLHYPDGTPNGNRLMTMQIMGMGYYKRQGYIYHPDYKSVYADKEETDKAQILGKYRLIPQQLFKHNHWIFKLSEPDDLNRKNDSQEMYRHDKDVYDRRKAANFYLDISKQ